MKALVDKITRQAYLVGEESMINRIAKDLQMFNVIEVTNFGHASLKSGDGQMITTMSITPKGGQLIDDDYFITFKNPLELTESEVIEKFYES